MKIPNHTLFFEKIFNLAESGGVVFEINISFNLSAGSQCSQEKIDAYFDDLKAFILVENKQDWQVRKLSLA